MGHYRGPTNQQRPGVVDKDRNQLFNCVGHECPGSSSATDAETLNNGAIAVDIRALKILEKTAALPDHKEQPASRVVIVLVGLEVPGEITDATRQHRHLDLGAPGVLG